DQNLTEMKVAMMPNSMQLNRRGQQPAEQHRQGLAVSKQTIAKRSVIVAEPGLFQPVEYSFGTCNDAVDPMLNVGLADWQRPEVFDVVATGQRDVHFGDALAGLNHVALIGRLLILGRARVGGADQPLFVDEAIERVT